MINNEFKNVLPVDKKSSASARINTSWPVHVLVALNKFRSENPFMENNHDAIRTLVIVKLKQLGYL